ncbi:hypothetical protein OIU76_005391 [Salix suchowensis]|nr:hypothetical protein OIU76_005391 [Salix suchowensis]
MRKVRRSASSVVNFLHAKGRKNQPLAVDGGGLLILRFAEEHQFWRADYLKCQCVHAHVVRLGHLNDIYVQNSLLDVYASCGYMGLCREVFDEMSDRDVVSWTVLIMGYRNAKNYANALIAFEKMQYAGVVPNRVTMVNALGACGSFRAIEMGVWIHDFIKGSGWDLDVILGTSLVEMYLKCGRIDEGLIVFRSMKEKNVFTWNVVIQRSRFC